MKEQGIEKTPKRDNRPSKPRRSRKRKVSPPAETRAHQPKMEPPKVSNPQSGKSRNGRL